MPSSGFHFQVVGLRHHISENQMRKLRKHAKLGPLTAYFEREPYNAVDKNAIRVIVDSPTSEFQLFIGYVRKEVAKVIAPGLDEGRWDEAVVRIEAVNVKHAFANAHCSFRKKPASKRKISS